MSESIYMDHAATTKMRPEVIAAMEPFYIRNFGNASTSYENGLISKSAIENSRQVIASCIGASPEEIYFTSGGSESDNWAIKGIAGAARQRKKHVITSRIEHHAILNSCSFLEELDYRVTYLPVNKDGIVDLNFLRRAVDDNTSLISVMFGNNEIGTIQPISEIVSIAKEKKVYVHTDAVQAVGQIPINVSSLGVDALSASAHKFNGPKGVGFLYVAKNLNIPSFIHGGAQEHGKRAGTENVAGIVGMAKALEIATRQMECNLRYVTFLRDYFIDAVLKNIPYSICNGARFNRLPGNISLSFKGIEATTLLVMLADYGIEASAGSACTTGQTRFSHVIEAISAGDDYKAGTIRFSLGYENTMEEVQRVLIVLEKCVKMLRM